MFRAVNKYILSNSSKWHVFHDLMVPIPVDPSRQDDRSQIVPDRSFTHALQESNSPYYIYFSTRSTRNRE